MFIGVGSNFKRSYIYMGLFFSKIGVEYGEIFEMIFINIWFIIYEIGYWNKYFYLLFV